MARVSASHKPKVTLFIGIPSASPERRATILDTWLYGKTTLLPHYALRFFLTPGEAVNSNETGVAYVEEGFGIGSGIHAIIAHKIIYSFWYAYHHFDFDYYLQADDDTIVNLSPMMHMLRTMIPPEDARRIYMGSPLVNNGVGEGDDPDSFAQGLRAYPPYHEGAGILMGVDVVRCLVFADATVGLKFAGFGDSSVGMWLAGMNVKFERYKMRYHPGLDWHNNKLKWNITEDYFCGPDAYVMMHPFKDPQEIVAYKKWMNCPLKA